MTLTEIWCSECGGFVGYVSSAQPLPSIMHGPCGERATQRQEAEPNPFATPLDDPRIQKMIDETASVWER